MYGALNNFPGPQRVRARASTEKSQDRLHTGVLEKIACNAGLLPDTKVSHARKNNIDDANGALRVTFRAVAKPGLAIEL